MRQELNNIEKIDLYLTNQLNKEELAEFEAEINQNPELAKKVAEHQLLIQAIKRQQLKKEILAIANGNSFWNFWTKLGLGTLLIGLLILGVIFFPINNSKAVAKYSKKEISNTSQKQDAIIETVLINQDSISQESVIEQSDSVVDNTSKVNYIKPTINKTKPTSISYFEDTECGGLKTFVEPNIQRFKVDANKGKTIEGEQGTLVIIPPKAFVDEQGININGTVDFELVEALTLEDMILYNLTTTSNGKQLETGGMFYMNATQNGKVIKVNQNAPIYTETPTEEIKKGMLAFDSEIDSSGNINWITPKPLKKYLTKIDLNLLDFLPEGFANGVEEGLPYKNHKKSSNELVDSLYYALGSEETHGNNTENQNMNRRNISITGSILNEKGKVLPYINVSIQQGDKTLSDVSLNYEGIYTNKIISLGNYTLVVTFIGNVIIKKEIEVKDRENIIPPITINVDEIINNQSKVQKSKIRSNTKYPTSKVEQKRKVISNGSFPNYNTESKVHEICGIAPLSIKTIKTPKFEQTYLATKEMEERISYLHQLDNGDDLLNIYIENLGGDLFVSDSLVAKSLTGKEKEQFEAFYNEKLTNVKDVNNIYQEQLSTFYNKKKKQYAEELNKLKITLEQKDKKELNRLNNIIIQNQKDYQQTTKPKVTPKTRLANTIGNLSNRIPQRSVASANSYPARWTSFGWKNIDKHTHLLSKSFESLEVTTNENKGFSRVFQYLNTIKTVTPLMTSNNIATANFPKRGTVGAKSMKNTYCFNLSKKDGKYFWGKKQYNPYAQDKITVETAETPIAKIRQELKVAGEDGKLAMNYFENAIKQEINRKTKQAENKARVIEEQGKRDALFKDYEEKQTKINAQIERKRQEQQVENDFMNNLRCIAFPCYDDNTVSNFSVIEEAKEWDDSITYPFATVEEKPKFPGGQTAMTQFISENIIYPIEAIDKNISGKIYVQFTINENGKVSNPTVVKSVNTLLDDEALRVIKLMPNWSSGMIRGQKVKVNYTIPVNFKN
jgi:TonB family protein